MNLHNRTAKERRRQTLCHDKRDIVIFTDFVVFRLLFPAVLLHKLAINYPHVMNYLKSLCKSEAKCEAIDMKSILCYHANKTYCHKKGFAPWLVLLKVRVFGTQKWPIANDLINPWCGGVFNPFARGDFAEKRILKVLEWFSGHCRAIKS